MADRYEPYSGGVVHSVSKYRENLIKYKGWESAPEEGYAARIADILREYHKEGTTPERKKELKHDLLMYTFFLIPHFLKSNYKLTAELFNEAVQQITENLLYAADLYDPDKGFNFSSYLIGYFKSGVAKTLDNCNVVSTATLRTAARSCGMSVEDVETAENPYIVRVRGESDDDEEDHEQRAKPAVDEPVVRNQRVLRGAMRVNGNAVELDDNRMYVMSADADPFTDIDDEINQSQMQEWLEEALDPDNHVLTPDESFALIHHFGIHNVPPKTYKQIAALRKQQGKGGACSRVAELQKKALAKLRKFFKNNNVNPY